MWKEAVWLGVPQQELINQKIYEGDANGRFVYYRLSFFLQETGDLTATISANSRYRLWVNGQPVLSGPCRSSGFVRYFDTVELGPYLQPGQNVIAAQVLLAKEIGTTITLGQVLDALHAGELAEKFQDQQLNEPVTLGQIVDFLKNNAILQSQRDREFTFKTSIGDLLELFGEENVKQLIQEKTASASYNADYERSVENVAVNWIMLFLFVLAFAALSTLFLEFIDKDKR